MKKINNLFLTLSASLTMSGCISMSDPNPNPTYSDPNTGLTWYRCTIGYKHDGTGCKGSYDFMTYSEAVATVKELNKEKFLGFSDWRIPHIQELHSLRNCYRINKPKNTNRPDPYAEKSKVDRFAEYMAVFPAVGGGSWQYFTQCKNAFVAIKKEAVAEASGYANYWSSTPTSILYTGTGSGSKYAILSYHAGKGFYTYNYGAGQHRTDEPDAHNFLLIVRGKPKLSAGEEK